MMASFAFGELNSDTHPPVWGAGVVDDDGAATVAAGSGEEITLRKGRVSVPDGGSEWPIALDGVELRMVPVDADGGSQTLCLVNGHITLSGERQAVACLGWRDVRSPVDEPDWTLLRRVAAWFSAEDGLAVMALRPRRARSHGEELVVAELLGADRALAEDPRLSTTYARDGEPVRAGVELWLGQPDSEELRPVRASGEAVGPAATWSQSDTSFAAQLFRWHSRGRDGAGVYLLGRRP